MNAQLLEQVTKLEQEKQKADTKVSAAFIFF